MEIVVITGVIALAGLVLLSLRMRASRGSVRKAGGARQWGGSAASTRRSRAARPAAAAAGGGGAVAFTSMGGGGGGVAVQDPPHTREADLDAWDDDLEWSDDLDAAPTQRTSSAGTGERAPAAPVALDEPTAAPVAEPEPAPEPEEREPEP